MSMTKKETDSLLRLVGLTKDDEIDCDECLSQVAELVEEKLAGKSVPERLEAVVHHLSVCPECREEYEALQRALGALNS